MDEPQEMTELSTRFKRSKLCRVIHVDGAWGSLTPQFNIHMALFSEHRAFPEGTTIRVNEQGTLEEIPTDEPGLLIREIEADVIIGEVTAVALRNWLTARINDLQSARNALAQAQLEQPKQG